GWPSPRRHRISDRENAKQFGTRDDREGQPRRRSREDPTILTGPFKIGYPWKRDNGYEAFEYACHEGNTLIWANIRSTSPRYAKWREENEASMAERLAARVGSGAWMRAPSPKVGSPHPTPARRRSRQACVSLSRQRERDLLCRRVLAVVADDLVDHEADELLAVLGVEIGFDGECAQAFDLARLAGGVARGQAGLGLVLADRLGDAEALGQHVDQRGIDVVDRLAVGGEHRVLVLGLGMAGHRRATLAGIPRLPSGRAQAMAPVMSAEVVPLPVKQPSLAPILSLTATAMNAVNAI